MQGYQGLCENLPMAKRNTPATAKVAKSTWATKRGLAQMLKGGVIMDVVTPAEAKVAEEAGAVAVVALLLLKSKQNST